MKKLSEELNKSYRLLIMIFSLSFVGLLLFFNVFMRSVSHNNIYSVYSFIEYEMGEFAEESLKVGDISKLFYGAIDEAPDVQGLTVVFKHKGKLYPNDIPKEFMDILDNDDFSPDVQGVGFYQYDFLHKKFQIDNMGQVDLLIIKDLINERAILINIVLISFILISFTIFLSVYI